MTSQPPAAVYLVTAEPYRVVGTRGLGVVVCDGAGHWLTGLHTAAVAGQPVTTSGRSMSYRPKAREYPGIIPLEVRVGDCDCTVESARAAP